MSNKSNNNKSISNLDTINVEDSTINISEENMNIFKSEIEFIIEECKDELNIKDNYITPLNWNYILNMIRIKFFLPDRKRLLFSDKYITEYEYDLNKVLYFYNVYRMLCLKYGQIINIVSFLDFTGIDDDTFYALSNRATSKDKDLSEKVKKDNEYSLENAMHDKSNNPMRFLASLNYRHNWSNQTVVHEHHVSGIGQRELPKLGSIGNIGLSNID